MATHKNCAYKSARTLGARWLAKVGIQAELTRLFNEKAMSAEEALGRLADQARGTHYHFIEIDEEGFVYFNFSDPEAKEYLHLIKKIKSKRERRLVGAGEAAEEWEGEWVEVELYDAQAALRDILKMHGKLTDRVDLTSKGEKLQQAVVNVYMPDNGRSSGSDGE